MAGLILAIDQGTSATKALLVDERAAIVAKASVPLAERHPQPGWVEQDGEALWRGVREAVAACLAQGPKQAIAAVGLSTQRESMLLWQRASGTPVSPLISWQDQRTVVLCEQLSTEGNAALVRQRSGLPLDPMFSALKARWLLDEFDPARTHATGGDWCLGTVDSYLLARLGGEHAIEVGNASRTQLLNVGTAGWDPDLLGLFGVPRRVLPQVLASVGPFVAADALHPALAGVPVRAVMGDSHSALFAHGGWLPGQVKATLGTGSSVMGLTRTTGATHPGLCRTIAWDTGAGPVQALEGNIRAAGSTLRWLADLFGLTPDAAAALAATGDAAGVCLVPGFNGLGAPWWDARAVGLISGLTLHTDRAALLRAALDSIAQQVADVVEAMDTGGDAFDQLHVDGGPSRNLLLLQTLAGLIARPVVHCTDPELSALGVAHLAGRGAGFWDDAALRALARGQHRVEPSLSADARQLQRSHWADALRRARGQA